MSCFSKRSVFIDQILNQKFDMGNFRFAQPADVDKVFFIQIQKIVCGNVEKSGYFDQHFNRGLNVVVFQLDTHCLPLLNALQDQLGSYYRKYAISLFFHST